jgi:hypothetical protein
MKIGDIASAVGKGLVAGAAGTLAITASQLLAQRFAGQEPSSAPVEAAEKVIGIEPKDETGEKRLSTLVHFVYGTVWGVPRALMELFGLRGWKATSAHLVAVQAAAGTVLPALDIAPPPQETPPKELGLEAFHHAVYAFATSAALSFLDRRSERAQLAA